MLLLFIGLYLAATLAIGYWASRRVKTTRDFVIAGRQLPMIVAASALFATWFGAETIMGASAEFVDGGLLAVIKDPFGAGLCLILIGLFYARPLYRLNILTFNDFFRLRFSRQAEFISAIFIVPSYFGWIAAQLVAMATILKVILGISLLSGVLICVIIVVIYTFIGGMWAVSITDFVQSFMILIGLFALSAQMLSAVGGIERVIAAQPEGFFDFLPPGDWSSLAIYFSAWVTVGLGSIPQQDVFQRVTAARSERTGVQASLLAGGLYIVIGSIPLLIGLCGQLLYPDIAQDDAQMVIPYIVLQHGSTWLQILFFGALLSAILSTTSGALLAPATVMGENLVRPYFPRLTDRQLLLIMRLSVIFMAIGSTWMALRESSIYHLAEVSSSFSLVSLFIPLTFGLYWARASNVGALLSIAGGMLVWGIFEWFPIEGLPSNVPGLFASLLGMLLGSWLWPDESFARFTAAKSAAGREKPIAD